MAEQVFVKFKGPHLLNGRELLTPGSVVSFDEATAEDLVKCGRAVLADGPAYTAPPPSWPGGACKADGTPMPATTMVPLTAAMVKVMAIADAEAVASAAEEEEELQRPAKPVEHADLGARLAQAERAVSRPQS